MFEKEKKYFPIKKDPACQLKWNWSTIWVTDATTGSCHRCLKNPIDVDNFDQFHNLPQKIKEREIMLSGKWPTQENGGSGHCNFCKNIEDTGGVSDRINHLDIPNQYPEELDKDPTATTVTPTILELFMNDTCNLKCTYCGSRNSSQWNTELKKHGPINIPTTEESDPYFGASTWSVYKKNKNSKKIFEKSLEWIEKNGHKLKRLHLLGGETFYQKELDEMLLTLKKIKNRNLEFNIVSNFMIKEDTFKMYIEQIKELITNKNIGRFDLTASIDGWGPEAEYARTGLKCDHFEKLFEYACNQKWMVLNTNQTVTSLTVKSIPLLTKKIIEWRKINPKIHQRFGMVVRRNFMHPKAYGYNFWKKDLENIVKLMPTDSKQDKLAMAYMQGQFRQITNNDPDMILVKQLKSFLSLLDQRRNTNWREVYPYLDI